MTASPSQSAHNLDQPIRLAASMVAFRRRNDGSLRVFMGRRPASAVFMPRKLVFPGGAVDAEDRLHPAALQAHLSADDQTRIRVHLRDQDGAGIVRAALREFSEETGLAPPADLPLTLLARAITPPGRTRRFDAWFFLTDMSHIDLERRADPDNELFDLKWRSLEEINADPLAEVTRFVLRRAELHLMQSQILDDPPFLREQDGQFIVTPMSRG